jgi:hypothetical protein
VGAALVALIALAALAAGCGSGTTGGTVNYVAAGQLPRADVPHLGGHGKHGTSLGTIPLAKENTTTALFSALGDFQACLTTKGVTFIGVPNASDPSSPANNPNYLKTLETCAAQSKILQALKAEQTAQDNLTPSQVKKENQIYLKWRTCMIGRGWGIPEPKPNTKGLLFSFGGTSVPQLKPPPGESLLSSSDLQSCAAKAEAEVSS